MPLSTCVHSSWPFFLVPQQDFLAVAKKKVGLEMSVSRKIALSNGTSTAIKVGRNVITVDKLET